MNGTNREVAVLGGGCFWCLEAVFEQLIGVDLVESGYAGGHESQPSYQAVCSGSTGHAEVVRITFDPAAISYREILELFFTVHDPTTLNRQGNDVGTQYRSVIFYSSPVQKAVAESLIAELTANGSYRNPIVTQVVAEEPFYKAEVYHQGYYRTNPGEGYCQFVVAPKVAKARQAFASRLRPPS